MVPVALGMVVRASRRVDCPWIDARVGAEDHSTVEVLDVGGKAREVRDVGEGGW